MRRAHIQTSRSLATSFAKILALVASVYGNEFQIHKDEGSGTVDQNLEVIVR